MTDLRKIVIALRRFDELKMSGESCGSKTDNQAAVTNSPSVTGPCDARRTSAALRRGFAAIPVRITNGIPLRRKRFKN
ncbi:hypothetical protein [Dyadobacter beijingensis]|uniref:hypothetical protein n=1 Tax=Dyadobacter beijingensis TaxID=365489 RepID=UPI0012FC7362|nr:hypothetical protein [Dyadobacter beijingensis]